MIPVMTDVVLIIPANINVCLKLFAICVAVTAGIIISDDTSNKPVILIDIAIVIAVSIISIVFSCCVFTPDIFADSSSNVIANNFL